MALDASAAAKERRARRAEAIEALRSLALFPSSRSAEDIRRAAVLGLGAIHASQGSRVRGDIEAQGRLIPEE